MVILLGKNEFTSQHCKGASLFHICRVVGVCESKKVKIFHVDGYDRRELPNLIWCSALLRLQLRKTLLNCPIPGSSANIFPCAFLSVSWQGSPG